MISKQYYLIPLKRIQYKLLVEITEDVKIQRRHFFSKPLLFVCMHDVFGRMTQVLHTIM